MQPYLIILIFLASTALARYHEKTRFDRSVHEYEMTDAENNNKEKQWSFNDDVTQFVAHKSRKENDCYLEDVRQGQNIPHKKRQFKILYASTALTKLEAWRIAGGRIADFCNGRNILLLQTTKPVPGQTLDPFFNEIPVDENDIALKRLADIILIPLKARTKRQVLLFEQREKLNRNVHRIRQRRQTNQFRGKFRGQTQSQYLNFGNDEKKEGKAEAEATQQSSRAVVSGSRGMGQAQSMSSGGTGCEDCPGYPGHPGYPGIELAPGIIQPGVIPRIPSYPGGQITYPTGVVPPEEISTYPGSVRPVTPGTDGTYPAGVRPGTVIPGANGTYPGGVRPGTVIPGADGIYPGGVHPGTVTPGIDGTYPAGVRPGTVIPGIDGTYPGGVRPGIVTPAVEGTYPGGVRPGTVTPGIDGTYPGGVRPGTVVPGADGTYPGDVRPGIVIPGIDGTYPGGVRPGIVTPAVEGTYPGGVRPGTVIPGVDGTYPGGVRPGTVIPGADGTYPGGVRPGTVIPGADGTYPGGVRPGIVTPTVEGMYPGGVRPGTVIPGADGTYPGGVRPGTVIPGADGTYPGGVRPGTVIPGADGTYPGGVRPGIVTPTVEGMYPGGVRPGTVIPGADGTYPGSVRPGTVIPGADGTYPGGVRPGTVIPAGADGTYPGGVRPGTVIPGGDRTYPPGTLITGDRRPYPGGIQPGGILPGDVTIGTYPGSIQPGVQPGQATYPPGIITTSVTTGATTVTGVGTYPAVSTAPGTGLPSGIYPRVPGTGTYLGTEVYSGVRPDTIPGTSVGTYPGGVVPGTVIQGVYPGIPSGTLPSGGQVPGTITTTVPGTGAQVITYPDSRQTNGQAVYPGPSGTIQLGRIPQGTGSVTGTQVIYPSVTYPGTIPGTYPGGAQQIPSPGDTLYPGQVTYPSGQVPTYPSGQYPGIGIPGIGGVQYPTDTRGQIIGGIGQYPGQYPGRISGQGIDGSQYLVKFYPGMVGTAGTGEVPQYTQTGGLTRPAGTAGVADDGGESQASSSVQQVDSGTQASASAQGKYGSGTAQSQVTGTYSGSGTFSAQAGTSDANKSAQTEISGGKEGATSNAQGVAGYGKSHTQVQLDSDSGATSTNAQSSGWNHGTNSQVQASSKGGMADAQANGEGNTSSQAQIGFQPYLKNDDEKVEKHATPFRGSGTASAQSGTHRGQSQSQLQGSFQYGITYTGAAQAGSGSGAASLRKPFNFTDTELFKPFKPTSPSKLPANVDSAQSNPSTSSNYNNRQDENKQNREQGLQSSSTSKQRVVLASKNNPDDAADKKVLSTEKSRTDDTAYDEYDDDDYTDDDDYSTGSKLTIKEKFSGTFLDPSSSHQKLDKTIQQQSRTQSQTIEITKGNQYNVKVNQDSNLPQTGNILQPGQSVSGYTIPPGFRGRVVSTSGTETVAHGDGRSQSQTVSLVPKDLNNNKSSLVTETRSLQTNQERYYVGRHTPKSQGSLVNQNVSFDKRTKPSPAVAAKPNYYTVTNSFAGKMNGNNEPRKYEHRYYTKSSTCGYFTFSCNVVYGSNGRTKICKPKVPTYSDGTPIRC